jgi:5-methyltetrahydrofolate--homocysteine methyltransferase
MNKFVKKFGAMLRGTIEHRAMIEEIYKGIRPAPGYPLVQITETTIWKLLNVEKEIGVTLTESMAMWLLLYLDII